MLQAFAYLIFFFPMNRGITKAPAHDILFLHLLCAEELPPPPGCLADTMIGRWGVGSATVGWAEEVGLVGVSSSEVLEGGRVVTGEEGVRGVEGVWGEEGVSVNVESSSPTCELADPIPARKLKKLHTTSNYVNFRCHVYMYIHVLICSYVVTIIYASLS